MSEVANRYTLKTPYRDGSDPNGAMLTELTVRRPIVRDLLATDAAKGEVGKAVALLSRLTGVDQKTLASMDGEDFEALSNMVGDFSDRPAPATASAG